MCRFHVLQPTTAHWFLVQDTGKIACFAIPRGVTKVMMEEWRQLRKCCRRVCTADLICGLKSPNSRSTGKVRYELFSRLALLNEREKEAGKWWIAAAVAIVFYSQGPAVQKERHRSKLSILCSPCIGFQISRRCLLYLCL